MGPSSEEVLRRRAMELTFDTLVDLFVATKQTEGCTENTTSWYRQKLEKFGQFLEAGATLAQVNLHVARAFVAHLQGKEKTWDDHPYKPTENHPLSAHTIQGYVRTLKSFSSWLEEESFTEENRLSKLKIPKAPKPIIDVLSDDEVTALFDHINPNCPMGGRLHAMLTLLLDTGIRAGECCGIDLGDVHMKENYFKVFGKGQKERLVPFGKRTEKVLTKWVAIWREELAAEDCEALFVNQDGYRLTYSALQQVIKRLAHATGVERLHPHLLRHTFAVRYLINGGDLMTLKMILGHTTLAVTEKYLHLAQSHVKVQYSKFSPMDQMHKKRRGRV